MNEVDLLAVKKAAALLGIGRSTAYRMIAEGHIKAARVRRLILVPRQEVERIQSLPIFPPVPIGKNSPHKTRVGA